MARVYPPVEERFWAKVLKVSGLNACWPWTGKTHRLNDGGSNLAVHRFSYALFVGPIPDGWWVRRKCGNALCVRPNHLEIFQHKGSNHSGAKLTEVQVLRMIREGKQGVLQRVLAERYGVSTGTVNHILHRKTWTSTVQAEPVLYQRKSPKKKKPREKKLTDEQVREIRRRREDGALVISLAEEFGYSDPSTISAICYRRKYKDVE